MKTFLFSLKPDQDMQDMLDSLKQSQIDQTKTYESHYARLSHVRSLLLEEILAKAKPLGSYDGDYLQDLRTFGLNYPVAQQKIRLAGLFIQPEEAKTHYDKLVQLFGELAPGAHADMNKKIQLLKQEVESGNVIFEVTDPTAGCFYEQSVVTDEASIFVDALPAKLLEEDDASEAATAALSRAISRAHEGEVEPVNLGIYSHIAIVKALRHFLYARAGKAPVMMPIAYSDGSQARPFPFLTLSPLTDRELEHLRKLELTPIGQVTDRHPEMDIQIARYIFRNQMVSVSRPLAETDEVAYQAAKKELEGAFKVGTWRWAFYQVGFQPVAIGFYRALVETLIESRSKTPWLEVIPYLFESKTEKYTTASPWS